MTMSKLFRAIGRIIRAIYRLIDKKLVLPITKLFVTITSKIKGNERGFERLITKKPGLIIISLIIAVGLFILADTKSTTLVENSAEVLYDQPITATYNEEAYVVEGLPETVDITLIGRKSDVYLAKQLPSNDITVDLGGLKPGVHKVELKYKKALSSVEYKLDPSVATIVIYEKKTEEKEIGYEVINKDKIDSKLIVSSVSLSTDKVYIKGTENTLKSVASVKALVDLNELSDDKKTAGSYDINKVKLMAYDSDGEPVNVEVVPSKITASVKITSPSKEVPIKVIPKNYKNIVFGKAINALTTDINKVTIYGNQSDLDKVDYIPAYVDVAGLKEEKKYSVTLKKPNGIRALSSNSVNVTVSLGEETTKEINDIYLEVENIGQGLAAQAVEEGSTKVTIIAKGVKSVLDNLDPTTIKAYVDLKDKTEGEYKVKIQVTGSDLRVKYDSKTSDVTIRITKN